MSYEEFKRFIDDGGHKAWITESAMFKIAYQKNPDFQRWAMESEEDLPVFMKYWERYRMEYLNPQLPTAKIEDDFPEEEKIELPTIRIADPDITQGMGKEIYDYLKAAKMDGRFRNCYSVAKIHNPTSLVQWISDNKYPDEMVERIFNMIDRELKINGYERL